MVVAVPVCPLTVLVDADVWENWQRVTEILLGGIGIESETRFPNPFLEAIIGVVSVERF